MINNMKKLVLSIAMVLAASFTFGQELTKEELKQQKRQIKALMNVANDAESNLAVDPTGAANAMRTVIASPLVNTDAYVWYVSANAKKGVVDEENRKRAEGAAFDEENTKINFINKDFSIIHLVLLRFLFFKVFNNKYH